MTGRPENKPRRYILSYPRQVRLARSGVMILLVGAALVRWGLAWWRFIGPALEQASSSAEAIQSLLTQPLRPLFAAHLGLLLTAGAVALIYDLIPDLCVVRDGLALRTLLGWKLIPWTGVHTVRVMSFDQTRRRLVLVQGGWSRWSPWPRLVSLCLGAGTQPGLIIASAMRDFRPLMGRLYREVQGGVPDAVFDEEFFSPPASLVLEPRVILGDVVHEAHSEGWPLAISARIMAAVPFGLVVVQLLILLLKGGAWWGPVVIFGLCELEWLLGTLYLFALAELVSTEVGFRETALLYPLSQIPRALLAVPMAMLVAAGLPFLAALTGMLAIVWAVTLTVLLVRQMYPQGSILPAAIGAAAQALFQFVILTLVFGGW
jgi:hypothetical protein